MRSLRRYIETISPNYSFGNFHVALSQVLDQFARGRYPLLIIQAPPQHGKSEMFSRLLPGYLFALHQGIDIIAVSYGDELARKNAVAARRYIEFEQYAALFPDVMINNDKSKKVNKQTEFETNSGSYRATGIGGSITGHGGSFILIDDPIKNQEQADSAAYRQKVWEFFTSTILTRFRPMVTHKGKIITGGIGLTLTRWHEDDLAGRLIDLAKLDPNFTQPVVFNFPAIKE